MICFNDKVGEILIYRYMAWDKYHLKKKKKRSFKPCDKFIGVNKYKLKMGKLEKIRIMSFLF